MSVVCWLLNCQPILKGLEMTRRERLEKKAELRREWAEGRSKKADQSWEKADLSEGKSGIPFGQPVLVGHHSESRHRKTIERAWNAMDKAHEHSEMAKTHTSKADGIESMLDNTIFSDDPDAVEALEAKITRLESEREQNNQVNKIIRKKPRDEKTPGKIEELIAMGLSEGTAARLFEKDCCGSIGIPSYVNQNLGGRIKAARDRLVGVKRQKELKEAAEASDSGVVIKTNIYGDYLITFAEKPEREILTDLKSAGYRWCKGSWVGKKDNLPESLTEYATI